MEHLIAQNGIWHHVLIFLVSATSNSVFHGSMAFQWQTEKNEEWTSRRRMKAKVWRMKAKHKKTINKRNSKTKASTEMQFVCKCSLILVHFPPFYSFSFASFSAIHFIFNFIYSMQLWNVSSWCWFALFSGKVFHL